MKYSKFGAKVVGVGSAVPSKVVTNFDLEKLVETSNDWIVSRTGISERRVCAKNEATSDLGALAAKKALSSAKIKASEIDLIITATCTPDMFFPSTSCIIANRIGAKNAVGFDVSAACSGFIFALSCAHQFIVNGTYKTALVIGADTLSKFTNWKDRNTCVLFGDGAGAVVLKRSNKEDRILATYLKIDGSRGDFLKIPAGGSRFPLNHKNADLNLGYIFMEGNKVFKFAVSAIVDSVKKVLSETRLKISDIDFFIPHQANQRIIDLAILKLGLSKNKVYVNLEKYGNTSAASIPLALDEACQEKKIKKGDLVLLSGFGAGLTYGASVIRW